MSKPDVGSLNLIVVMVVGKAVQSRFKEREGISNQICSLSLSRPLN
jgi:hypothetical protein